jgi:dTMP kinase
MATGFFISLDGVDGAGKSTQCRMLVDWLRQSGHEVIPCRDPGGTPFGQRIREILLDRRSEMTLRCEALLYMASRAQLCDEVIRPALARGAVVVSDRFLLANVAYQGHGGGLDPDWLWQVGRSATDGLIPDLTLVLDVPPALSMARKQGPVDRLEARGLEYLERVRRGFLSEAGRSPQSIRVVDATRPADEAAAEIQREVQRALDARLRT